MDPLLLFLRSELAARSNAPNQQGAQRFFKESIRSYGLKMADTRALAKQFLPDLQRLDKKELFHLCEELWRSGMMEEGNIATAWALGRKKAFAEEDGDTFARWIGTYIGNWAHCDDFCNNVMGTYFEKFPQRLPLLQQWALSPNRWLRRAAAVSLIVPARRGRFLPEGIAIATTLLEDADDLVQKGYGWLLKEQCKTNENAVFAFVLEHRHRMPRTALRYAIETMPAERRAEAMAK